jgi:RimJ/RimL family protein N-acetyltransferase
MQEEKHIYLNTERLIIRPININDAQALFEYRSNKEINRYQGWIPETIEDVNYFIENKISPKLNIPGTWYQMALILKANNEMIGDIGVHFPSSEPHQVELGCSLNYRYHGKGYASEALEPIISFIFQELDKHRIIASIDSRNQPSIRLIERLGFQKKAHIKEKSDHIGIPTDDLIYAIKKEEWEFSARQ